MQKLRCSESLNALLEEFPAVEVPMDPLTSLLPHKPPVMPLSTPHRIRDPEVRIAPVNLQPRPLSEPEPGAQRFPVLKMSVSVAADDQPPVQVGLRPAEDSIQDLPITDTALQLPADSEAADDQNNKDTQYWDVSDMAPLNAASAVSIPFTTSITCG